MEYNSAYHIFFFFQAEDGIRDYKVTGVQTCALPICEGETRETAMAKAKKKAAKGARKTVKKAAAKSKRSEEHTSELQSPCNLVCRLLLEKKKKYKLKSASISVTKQSNEARPPETTYY